MQKAAVLGGLILIVMLMVPAVSEPALLVKEESSLPGHHQEHQAMVVDPSFPRPLPLRGDGLAIVSPRSVMPVIVRPQDLFIITVSLAQPAADWEARLDTAYDLVVESFSLPVREAHYFQDREMWRVQVLVPETATPELYNLTVTATFDGGTAIASEPRAVSVVSAFKRNFSFVHLTDFHIGDPRGFTEDINRTLGWKAAKKSIQEINLLNPDFVLISGDLVFGQLYPFEYAFEYRTCYDILQRFQVPTYVAPGNHDGYIQCGQDGLVFWERFFAPRYYSFDYGPYHFTAMNSYDWPNRSRWAFSYLAFNWGGNVGSEQLAWLEADARAASDAPLSIMFMHHNPLWDTVNDSLLGNGYAGREELLNIIQSQGIDAVLAGHVHYDHVTTVNHTLYLTTTTVASGLSAPDAYWGYRLVKVAGDTIQSHNYREPKYSIPLYRLNYTYDRNDGTTRTVTATCENDLNIDAMARLCFYAPEGEYVVDNGVIVDQRSAGGITKTVVDAVLPAGSETEVTLHPS